MGSDRRLPMDLSIICQKYCIIGLVSNQIRMSRSGERARCLERQERDLEWEAPAMGFHQGGPVLII